MSHGFSLGDGVLVCTGQGSGRTGTITKILPDPKGQGRDLITVRLEASNGQLVNVSVYPGDLRPAR